MKQIGLIISVPDCFEPETNKIEISIKGMPKGKYIEAELFEFIMEKDDETDDDI